MANRLKGYDVEKVAIAHAMSTSGKALSQLGSGEQISPALNAPAFSRLEIGFEVQPNGIVVTRKTGRANRVALPER